MDIKVGDRVYYEFDRERRFGTVRKVGIKKKFEVEFGYDDSVWSDWDGWWCGNNDGLIYVSKKDVTKIGRGVMFREGDLIVNISGEKAKILAVCGQAFLRSRFNNFDYVGEWCTQKDAEEYGWKLYTEDEDVEITVEGKTTKISRKSAQALGLIK